MPPIDDGWNNASVQCPACGAYWSLAPATTACVSCGAVHTPHRCAGCGLETHDGRSMVDGKCVRCAHVVDGDGWWGMICNQNAPWTPAADRAVQAGYAAGRTPDEIGIGIDRFPEDVRERAGALGLERPSSEKAR